MPVLDPRALPFDELIRREWLITNGAGGYASSTAIGLNTRKYHGLLVAATRPPVGRSVILSRVEETIQPGGRGRARSLACAEYPGVIHPCGHELLRAFSARPFPRWAYQGDGWTIEKSVRFSPSGPNDLVITYTLLGGEGELELLVKPLFALRGIHELSYRWSGRLEAELPDGRDGAVRIPATPRTPPAYFAHDGTFVPRPDWYLSTIYRRERERGYAASEDLWTPGTVSFRLSPGRAVHLAVSTEPIRLDHALLEIRREDERRREAGAPDPTPANTNVPLSPEATTRFLNDAGERFFVWTSASDSGAWTCLIPQFPWTPLSVRDVLISMPGLLLVPGKLASARTLLVKLAAMVRDGLLPSELSETGEPPAYNAADVSLWFVFCVGEYLRYAQASDSETAGRLLPVLRQIVDAYRSGTRLGIGVNGDGLLRVRENGIGTTWMNARVGNWVITPRQGRPVEVNALWYNALRVVADVAEREGDGAAAGEYRSEADRHRAAFNRRFWNAGARCCYDVVYDAGADAAIRPNQLLAVSLPHPVLSEDRWSATVETVAAKLLTPRGIRTLSPDHSAYQGRYAGDVVARDRAYHQGCAYPWLLGPYASAVARASGRTPAGIERIKSAMRGCLNFMRGEGLGLLPELFDGDAPHRPGGAVADARGVAEIARAWAEDVLDRRPQPAAKSAPAAGLAAPAPAVAPAAELPNPSRTPQLT